MSHPPEPLLTPTPIAALRPTQMTLGYREVARKRQQWAGIDRDRGLYLGRHLVPVVIGPDGRPWMLDHHHLVRALHEEGVAHVLVQVVARAEHLDAKPFLRFLDMRGWLHPFDALGRRRPAHDIPHHIGELVDDPYRSLAAELRRAGGFAHSDLPFVDFLWAEHLRTRLPGHLVRDAPDEALTHALGLARRSVARHLPGWCGPVPGDVVD
jgi:hypothetical protein